MLYVIHLYRTCWTVRLDDDSGSFSVSGLSMIAFEIVDPNVEILDAGMKPLMNN